VLGLLLAAAVLTVQGTVEMIKKAAAIAQRFLKEEQGHGYCTKKEQDTQSGKFFQLSRQKMYHGSLRFPVVLLDLFLFNLIKILFLTASLFLKKAPKRIPHFAGNFLSGLLSS